MQRITLYMGWVTVVALVALSAPRVWAADTQAPAQARKAAKQAANRKAAPPVAHSAPKASMVNASVKEAPPAHLRDPFAALVRTGDAGEHLNLPPGIAGLQVSTLRLQGLVKGPEGMIAVVANPQDRVYFLHEGDHIFDGLVEKIDMDKMTFQQVNKDAFGRPVQREVVKRLYPIAGEEQ